MLRRRKQRLGSGRAPRCGRDTSPPPRPRCAPPTARLWLMNTTVSRIACCSSASRFRICACTDTSSALVGSSQITMRGCTTSARAIATRCRCPPESCAGVRAPNSGDSPTRSSNRRHARRWVRHALHHQRQRHDVAHPAPWIQRGHRVLEHRLHQPRPRPPVHPRQFFAEQPHLPLIWRLQPQQQAAPAKICRSRIPRRCPAPCPSGTVSDTPSTATTRRPPTR